MSGSVRSKMKVTYITICSTCVCQTFVLMQLTTTEAWPFRELWLWIRAGNCSGKAQVEVSTYLMPEIVTGEGNIGFHCE